MKTLFISHDTKLDGVTLEEVMDQLGVKKQLTLQEKQKVSIIEDINDINHEIAKLKGRRMGKMPASIFDQLYDSPIKSLLELQRLHREAVSYERYQAGLSGQIDPRGPIQGEDF